MEDANIWVGIVIGAIPGIASAISAAFPDTKLGRFAGLVNTVALNFGNAKNEAKPEVES